MQVINREPEVADANGCEPLQQLRGAIELTEVYFSYPARPDVQVFSGLNLSVAAGQNVALVGESGSGELGCQAAHGSRATPCCGGCAEPIVPSCWQPCSTLAFAAGKSTVVSLVMRYYDATQGKVRRCTGQGCSVQVQHCPVLTERDGVAVRSDMHPCMI